MKRIILAVALVASAPAMALDCSAVSHYAEKVMKSRQSGLPMSAAIKNIDGAALESAMFGGSSTKQRKAVIELATEIIITAYDRPSFRGMEPYTTNSITEHGNRWMVDCMKGNR